jgi:O-succinylbenzoic acid--CoA ligase
LEQKAKLEITMELILKNGIPTEALKNYAAESDWVKRWNSRDSNFTFLTSGTSGSAKEILFSREQIEKSAWRTAQFFKWSDGMEVLHSLPMQYVAGRMNVLRALITKQSVWKMTPKVEMTSNDFYRLENIEWWTLTPPMLSSFLSIEQPVLTKAKLLVGGAPVVQSLIDKAQGVGNEIWESYGAAETLTHIALRKLNGNDKSKGFKPLHGVSIKMTEQGMAIDDGFLGNAVVTSDLGTWINDKEFIVEGRIDDIINSGGVKINPLEVEKIIHQHMKEAGFVKGSKDDRWGQIVTWVVKYDTIIPQDWQDWFISQPLLKPKLIVRVDVLPQNENGKWIRK